MNRFTFRLDSVLQLRIAAEQERQRDLAIAQVRLVTLESEMAKLKREIEAAAADLASRFAAGAVDARWLLLHERHERFLRHRLSAAAQRLERIGRDLEAARSALVAASAQRNAMEKLREGTWRSGSPPIRSESGPPSMKPPPASPEQDEDAAGGSDC